MHIVYRARPVFSRSGSWGRGVGKARGLADVISMHEVLTNQILLRDFQLVVTPEHFVL